MDERDNGFSPKEVEHFSDYHNSDTPPEAEEIDYIDFAPTFLAVEDPPLTYLVNELIPTGVIALLHGEPRTRKTWAVQDIAVAVATGNTKAFGLDRFAVAEPVPVLYSSQEDGAALVRMRIKALLRGRGIERWPDTLAFSVHRGINFDSSEWRERLLRDIKQYGFRLVIFDPIRRYSEDVDKGPAEVHRLTAFLRQIVTETGATVIPNHHDVKPPSNGKDDRRRAHKASGGDWFAASECPIAFETAGETRTLVYPESYKSSSDPAPFSFVVESDEPKQPKSARLIGEDATVEHATDLATQEKILAYLAANPRRSTRDIERGCKMRNGDARPVLERLSDAGQVDCLEQGKGKATLWWIREAK